MLGGETFTGEEVFHIFHFFHFSLFLCLEFGNVSQFLIFRLQNSLPLDILSNTFCFLFPSILEKRLWGFWRVGNVEELGRGREFSTMAGNCNKDPENCNSAFLGVAAGIVGAKLVSCETHKAGREIS